MLASVPAVAMISTIRDETAIELLYAVDDAFLAWLMTPPTTLADVIARLDHASRRAYED
jgi:hypothetical protein